MEINQRNAAYWERQRSIFAKRMADDAVRETAFAALRAEELRQVALCSRLSLEQALEDAERVGRQFLIQHARKGGAAEKTDSLQFVIQEIVTRHPRISASHLVDVLRARQGIEPIEDIEEDAIWFTTINGASKSASLSGLKDRLSRAKKKRSR